MASQRGLKVRGFERQLIELPIEFMIAEEHRAQVRFSSNSAAVDQFAISGVTFDVSVGGLGFRAAQLLPRHCEGVIRLMAPPGPSSASGSSYADQPAPVRIECRAKVRRVWMNTKDHSFSIGLAFVNPTHALEADVESLLNDVSSGVVAQTPTASGARTDA